MKESFENTLRRLRKEKIYLSSSLPTFCLLNAQVLQTGKQAGGSLMLF